MDLIGNPTCTRTQLHVSLHASVLTRVVMPVHLCPDLVVQLYIKQHTHAPPLVKWTCLQDQAGGEGMGEEEAESEVEAEAEATLQVLN
jgi:hypothetical protein